MNLSKITTKLGDEVISQHLRRQATKTGMGTPLRLSQVKKLLRLNGAKFSDFDKIEPEISGLVERATIKLKTGARVVRERHRKSRKSKYWLRVSQNDTSNWRDVFMEHIGQVGGLFDVSGYGQGFMV